jgi:hypothetical protein
MENQTVHEFEYRGYKCTIMQNEFGFWGAAAKPSDEVEHTFPEKTLEKEIEELKFSIDSELREDEDNGNCHICGGCPDCGAYCTTDCSCNDNENMDYGVGLDDDDGQ